MAGFGGCPPCVPGGGLIPRLALPGADRGAGGEYEVAASEPRSARRKKKKRSARSSRSAADAAAGAPISDKIPISDEDLVAHVREAQHRVTRAGADEPVDVAALVKALQARAIAHLRAGEVADAKHCLERAALLGETAVRDTATAQAAQVAIEVAPCLAEPAERLDEVLSARYTPR